MMSGGKEGTAKVQVAPVGAVATASLLWRTQGVLHLTVIVKASFTIVDGGMMALDMPQDIVSKDQHRDGDPTKSLDWANECVPFRPRCDAWCTGEIYAPGDTGVRTSAIRFGVFQQQQRPVVDKWLLVHGERAPDGTRPEMFRSMPLCYERAALDREVNPVGCDPLARVPNIVLPAGVEGVAGLGPISRYWRSRRDLITADQRAAMEAAVPVFAADIDWGFFQAAPRDQQLPYLRGDEWLVLEGLHPRRRQIQSQLPSVRAVARLWRHGAVRADDGDELNLVADTLVVASAAEQCVVVWRGSTPLDEPDLAAGLRVAAGVRFGAEPVDWRYAFASSRVTTSADSAGVVDEWERTSIGPASENLDKTHIDPPRSENLRKTHIDPPPSDSLDKTHIDPPRSENLDKTHIDPPRSDSLETTAADVRDPRADVSEDTDAFVRARASSSLAVPPGDTRNIERLLREAGAEAADVAAMVASYGRETPTADGRP
jgi:hypothetical protein